jgi:hypothetical protein
MPDEPESDEATATATAEAEAAAAAATAEAESEPTPADLLERERAERLRAEGRAAALQAELDRARPAEKPAPPITVADIEREFQAGRLSEPQRIQYLADLQVQARQREAEAQAATARIQQTVSQKVNAYVERYPDLGQAGSPAVTKVWQRVAELAQEEGLDPQDLRTQHRALLEVYGPLTRPAMADAPRQKIPVGAAYGSPGSGTRGAPAPDPLKDVPPALLQHWTRRGYSREQMLAELPHVNRERWTRRG